MRGVGAHPQDVRRRGHVHTGTRCRGQRTRQVAARKARGNDEGGGQLTPRRQAASMGPVMCGKSALPRARPGVAAPAARKKFSARVALADVSAMTLPLLPDDRTIGRI